MDVKRCWGNKSELSKTYHDKEWGTPVHDDQVLFEFIILEGAQAGLNWNTILNKRENYRKALDNFDFNKVAKYGEKDVERLLNDEGIVRNKLKVRSAIQNAKTFVAICKEFGSFDKYLWAFVDYKPIDNGFKTWKEVPAKTELSDKISKDLKKRGMNFVGSTIIYAFMQAVGMVNDHMTYCFKYEEIASKNVD
ncbi:MAG: DNA-3-methyladenine glycosylase I [Candidatus Heimdallarchaeota archaeon]|nr:DNA-3-methyladenine glycosylase I [Candidatus Heimdallarchaeota archaeon]MCK4972503.1 DNA-3-methyladenine glycosylase I [Candidatus Heimdallarchaeota archaeon]